jgi:hypothetical protein
MKLPSILTRRGFAWYALLAFTIWWCSRNPHDAAAAGRNLLRFTAYAVGQLSVFARKAA